MTIDWTKPLVVAGTDRVATVVSHLAAGDRGVEADWFGTGRVTWLRVRYDTNAIENAVTNAPPTPQIGPDHIEALAEAIELAEAIAGVRKNDGFAPAEAAEQRAARLAEIRAYLESR